MQTIVYDNAPGDKRIQKMENGDMLVRARFVWHEEGKPIRQERDVELDTWIYNVPWAHPMSLMRDKRTALR